MKAQALCAALLVAAFTAGAASAQDTQVAVNVGVVSDYVFRGFSETGEDPALQAGVDLSHGNWYAGAWASKVDFGDDADAEVDLYGGYRTEAVGWALDFGLVGYGYVNAPSGADYNYLELKAAASRAIGPVTGGVALYYSPDFYGADEEALYAEVNGAFEVAPQWTVSGAVGHQSLDVGDDYTTWNAGVAWAFTDNLALDVRYHDTDVDGPLSEDRIVAGLKVVF